MNLSSLCLNFFFFSVTPGGRNVYADIIRVYTPSNFFACNLALAASFGLFHGTALRRVTSGQLPVLSLKSLHRGKSQGKSGVGRLIMKCVSCWKRNKISHRLKIETIKKKASFTSLPVYFDDVNDGKFLGKITEGFDDGLVYETSEVKINFSFLVIIFTFNMCCNVSLLPSFIVT